MSQTLSPKQKQEVTVFLVLMVALYVVMLVIVPLLIIWALNAIFPALHIPSNFTTWLAVLVLFALFHPRTSAMIFYSAPAPAPAN
jgi:hypothetical protein